MHLSIGKITHFYTKIRGYNYMNKFVVFMLLIWTSFLGQFIPPVGGERIGKGVDGYRYFSQLCVSLYTKQIYNFAINKKIDRQFPNWSNKNIM